MKYSSIASFLTATFLGSTLLGLAGCQSAKSPNAPSEASGQRQTNSSIVASPSPAGSPSPSNTNTARPPLDPKSAVDSPAVPQPAESQPPIGPEKTTNSTPYKTAKVSPESGSLNIYKADNQCNALVSEKVNLPAATADAAVGRVIANSNSPDFRLVGYRVKVDNGTATVDLRLPEGSKRPFSALSACEQLELFGSVEKTLLGNASLKIQAVRFRDGQKELQF